jgi:hypothetical protein
MHTIEPMLNSHPRDLGDLDLGAMAACIQACYECAATCTACADACLGEESVAHLVRCIRTDLDCADVCETTGRVLSRLTEHADLPRHLVEACAEVCRACATECERHAEMHEHCRICAEACRRCEQACRDLLTAVG